MAIERIRRLIRYDPRGRRAGPRARVRPRGRSCRALRLRRHASRLRRRRLHARRASVTPDALARRVVPSSRQAVARPDGCVAVYPEGQMHRGPDLARLQPFRHGGFRLPLAHDMRCV